MFENKRTSNGFTLVTYLIMPLSLERELTDAAQI
jgi:hypothetical protein